jgi:hypothetical protein
MKWQSLVSITSFCKKNLPSTVTSLSRSTSFLPITLTLIIVLLSISNAYTQDNQQQDYQQVIKARSEKIVNVLSITDSDKYNMVVNDLMDQYSSVNTIHEQSKEAVDEIKQQSLSKEESEEAVKQQEVKKNELLKQQHAKFIAQLNNNLTEEQVEKVKDGMTYRVFPITYAGYLDMLPSLTTEQKGQIYAWLKEARELAMDAESSEKKHAVFGKYKGRINNYLSKAGYDMNKESKAWQERIKQKQKTN